ncbi:hypothetical protein [Argonema antarcticum]|nr:hypothetical protein [Argonema antarcticum]
MKVVVDTSVWSIALRRNTPESAIAIVHITSMVTAVTIASNAI